ncbi:hypothetical protein Q5530_36470 [Saccharothrix sp. BKS2]|uniref:hypothetical protein n=1 Tax=Saccharothrix sp. BKS2 TaxID=3064400 RepID=UPI0039E7F29F
MAGSGGGGADGVPAAPRPASPPRRPVPRIREGIAGPLDEDRRAEVVFIDEVTAAIGG